MILIMPLPQVLQMMITRIGTMPSIQLVNRLSIAEPARLIPMRMISGPQTAGGNSFITLLVPRTLIRIARITYRPPAATTPPVAYSLPYWGIIA